MHVILSLCLMFEVSSWCEPISFLGCPKQLDIPLDIPLVYQKSLRSSLPFLRFCGKLMDEDGSIVPVMLFALDPLLNLSHLFTHHFRLTHHWSRTGCWCVGT